MRSKAAKVALCGVVSALSVVLMLMTGIVPIATIALPALAGCLTIAIVAETNVRYGFAVYCVVSVLAILLTPDREAILAEAAAAAEAQYTGQPAEMLRGIENFVRAGLRAGLLREASAAEKTEGKAV